MIVVCGYTDPERARMFLLTEWISSRRTSTLTCGSLGCWEILKKAGYVCMYADD